jgi:cell division protein ZapA
MGKLSLKVVVAGRSYPLTVSEGEENKVLKAAEDINKSIQLLQDNYAVKDMQDLLAMTALQLATKKSNTGTTHVADYDSVEKQLDQLLNDLNALK